VKLAEIRGKDSRELALDMQALRKEYFGMKFRAAAEEVSNTSRFKAIRRTIARIQTILAEREAAKASAPAASASEGSES
jgi:large subunit ribosomal protein L29